MKKLMKTLALPMLALLTVALLVTSCKKDDSDVIMPRSYLMTFNLAADKAAVGFTLAGERLTNVPLNFPDYSGVYLPIYPGSSQVNAVEFGTGASIAGTTGTFVDSAFYSAFLLGANGSYTTLLVNDNLNALPKVQGKAWVRYINAIPDSAASVVTIGTAFNETAAYGSISTFAQVDAGSVTIVADNAGTVNVTRTLTLEEYKVYTVLIAGLPGSTNPSMAPQVRFITNGIVTD